MWRILFICLIFVKLVLSEYKPASVALGETPVVNKKPDLTEIIDEYYTCFSIGDKNNKACEGYDYYIPKSGYYGYSDTSSDFSSYVNSDVSNDNGYIIALCPDVKHDTSKIAYRYSVYCGRMMYSQARWCKENDDNMRSNPQLSLCKKTCLDYAESIVDYSKNICKNTDHTLAEQIKKNIIEKWCNIFTDDAGCIQGTKYEVENCGYSSASISKEAQSFNPSNSCWKIEGKAEEIQNQATKEVNKEFKMGTIRWKISYPIGVIIIIGALTFIFWRKQNEKYKIGYVPSNKDNDDYEIIPSSAEPSRDYIDENFLKNAIEFPESTLQRKSSFAVSTISRTSRANSSKSNVIYMIALYNYHAKMNDELELKAGDRIRVEHKYDDGWAAGINETTNKFGAFPLICCTDNISSNQGALPVRNKSSRSASTKSIKLRANNSVKTLEKSPLAKKDED
ncbi:hypothetical protein H8356DRAFT_1662899 [Neocallimastix lanati (nom. inval.)]|jgi:hypothetical protein|uniref:SH3 domain-containing protein n=1 Tax=Neocallimastix californiae TaxID=1754190 RepID=A0A1Y1Z336_9FUNG|nr:hypothetical protein H8356DRAFT_1662899 [Neocallimastix sp. JGI-2020a]ORY04702.1 hypothetical protein LY90DRAFT_678504 [Neocallimastix californiae]|eukprot:ORY04702.1 hypothetical protein LY90DRAFT_678504 [Neocallimastix californiae]